MEQPAVDTIARLVPAILKALYALEFTGRHITPQTLLTLSGLSLPARMNSTATETGA